MMARPPKPRTFNDPAKAAAYAARLARELGTQVEYHGAAPTPPSPSPPERDQTSFRAAEWDADIAAEQERADSLAQAVFTELKDPTATDFPEPPLARRSTHAEYDPSTQILRIWWRRPGKLGDYTNYYNVTPQEWDQIENRVDSTGKYVNRVLNYKYYDYL